MIDRKGLGMKNRMEAYTEIKKDKLLNEVYEEKLPPADQDSDCWSHLWQLIKTKSSRVLK